MQEIRSRYAFKREDSFSAPEIPLNKLSNALSTWLVVDPNEKVLGLFDTSIFGDAKNGIAFTEQRIIWKEELIQYGDLAELSNRQMFNLLLNSTPRTDLRKLIKFVETSPNPTDYDRLVSFFNGQLSELLSNKADAKELFEFVNVVKESYSTEEDYENLVKFVDRKLAKLFSDKKSRTELFYFVDVVKSIFSQTQTYEYLRWFFNDELAKVLSNYEKRGDLSKLIGLVEKLSYEKDRHQFVRLLKEVGQQYSVA